MQNMIALRLSGAAMILAGAMLVRNTLVEEDRRIQRTRLALADAFESMASEIRLLLTPVPELLQRECCGEVRAFFSAALRQMREGAGPEQAFEEAARLLTLPEDEKKLAARIGGHIAGSEESACAALALAASSLRRGYERAAQMQKEKDRMTTTLCISAALFAAILLF